MLPSCWLFAVLPARPAGVLFLSPSYRPLLGHSATALRRWQSGSPSSLVRRAFTSPTAHCLSHLHGWAAASRLSPRCPLGVCGPGCHPLRSAACCHAFGKSRHLARWRWVVIAAPWWRFCSSALRTPGDAVHGAFVSHGCTRLRHAHWCTPPGYLARCSHCRGDPFASGDAALAHAPPRPRASSWCSSESTCLRRHPFSPLPGRAFSRRLPC